MAWACLTATTTCCPTPAWPRREAHLAYLATLFREVGDAQPEALAGDVMALETAIARIHWTKVQLRDPQSATTP